MLMSYTWIKNYVDIDVDAYKLGDMLTNAGVIVDNVHDLNEGLNNCVVGKLIDVSKHKDSDRLYICKVDVGNETLQIVTAAENVKSGQLVPVAKVGAKLPNGLRIKKTNLRGIDSCGMLISLEELNYDVKVMQPEEKEGIFIFPPNSVSIGQEVSSALGMDDFLLELDLTPNRADCSSLFGMAIEVAALLNEEVKLPKYKISENDKQDLSISIEDKDLCSQYYGIVLTLENNTQSPLWLQNRLRNASLRPISLVVDIANYVMLETGQPLHTFDFDRISEGKIIVRRAKEGEVIKTLDEKDRKVVNEDLLITDPEKAVGIAGVMGGFNSEITNSTKRILLESAIFNRESIRRTSRRLNIFSEAASRFSKGLGPELSKLALERFIQLYEELNVGKVVSNIVRAGEDPYLYKTIKLRPNKVSNLAGQDIKISNMSNYLVRLGFNVKMKDDIFEVEVPSRRIDIIEEIDLVEEVLRMEGFSGIKSTQPDLTLHGNLPENVQSRRNIKEILRASGASEAVNYSFHSPEEIETLKLTDNHGVDKSVLIDNPISSKLSVMRTTLLPGLVSNVKYNLNRQVKGILLAEFGTVFLPKEKSLPIEHEMFGIIAAGVKNDESWFNKEISEYDFFDVKGIIETVFHRLNIEVKYEKLKKEYLHPGRAATIISNNQKIGYLGELHPDVVHDLGLEANVRIIYAEINHDLLMKLKTENLYEPISQFPNVERDLAIVINKDISIARIIAEIKNCDQKLLKEVELFDLYEGKQVDEGYKSCAFRLIFEDKSKTLKAAEINKRVDKIIETLENKFQAVLR
ncbi:MAG: phenylalanine--tRNA ligase subunit beta [Clostridia bacterium]